jgi:hypothetical protein
MPNTNQINEVEFTKEFLKKTAEQLKAEAARCEAAVQKIESEGALPEAGGDGCVIIRADCIVFPVL